MLRKNDTSPIKRCLHYLYSLAIACIAYLSLSWFKAAPGNSLQDMDVTNRPFNSVTTGQ